MRFIYITTIGETISFFKNIIEELVCAGHEVDIASNGSESPVADCFSSYGCKIYQISCDRSVLKKGNFLAIKEIYDIVKNGNYDIVHCHTPIAAACTRMACKGLRKKGIKVYYTAHGFHFYDGAPWKNWMIYYPIEWICSWWTDTLITINTEDYARAKKKFHSKRIEYVPGVGLDTSKFLYLNDKKNVGDEDDSKNALREELGISYDAFILMSAGELNHNKNHAVMIKALAELKNPRIHYVIAGQGELYDYLENLAEHLKVGNQVHLLGYRNDIPELYKCSNVCVFPSIREGLGLAAIEGLIAGLPLVCSDNRGARDFAVNGENAYICKYNDVHAFAENIDKLFNNPEICKKMGSGYLDIADRFDVKAVNKIMFRIYHI